MHVVVNALFLDPPMGGVETYLRELCRALVARDDAPRLTVLLTPAGEAALRSEDWAASAELVRCGVLGRGGLRAGSELSLVGALADLRAADVVHSVAMTGPLLGRAARVVTVPDTIWMTHPEPGLTHRLWQRLVPVVTRRADRVIAISHAAADELRVHLRVPEAQLDVVPLGHRVAPSVTRATRAELQNSIGLGPGPTVLNVGQKKPHRNLERLVRAMPAIRAAVPGAQLVLPGPPNPAGEARLRELAVACGVGNAVVIPGFVDQAQLEGLYAEAAAFVLPSILEGFGLPALEAMARGTPVACSRQSAPAEVAGDAGLLFDPYSEREIAEATVALLRDAALRQRLADAGRRRARTYTWERCAAETIAVYRRAYGFRS